MPFDSKWTFNRDVWIAVRNVCNWHHSNLIRPPGVTLVCLYSHYDGAGPVFPTFHLALLRLFTPEKGVRDNQTNFRTG